MAHFGPTRRSLLQGTLATSRTRPYRISRARRRAVEEICRHHHRSQPDQGAARRAVAEIRLRIHRSDRHQGRIRSHSGAAAAAEGGDRTHFRQAELRRHPRQLSRAEAAIRKGRLARRPDRLHEGSEPDRARSQGRRFFRRRPAICPERQGRNAFAALVGRLFHSLLEQGAVREEGRDAAENPGRDGGRRGKAQRPRQRNLRLHRPRPAQRQHDAVDQFLPRLWRRIPRRQGQYPDRRPGGDRGHQDCISGC